jgi:hypothetical protein
VQGKRANAPCVWLAAFSVRACEGERVPTAHGVRARMVVVPPCSVKVRKDLACALARGRDRERSTMAVLSRGSRGEALLLQL